MTKSFSDLGVPEDLVASLASNGVMSPFPIQVETLSDSLAGRDICGRAPTGSGKTLAFSLPLVSGVERARPRSPRGLVLVPTRELAAQVEEVIAPLAKARGLRVMSIYGGVGFEPQMKQIRRGVDIVVACPGRLQDLVNREALTLADVSFVVIDEADRMADMGFLPEVKRLLDQTNRQRQTLLFSATLDGDVDVLIRGYQNNPVRHSVAVDEDEEDNRLHLFWRSPRETRVTLLADILKRTGSTVVFSRTKHGADRIARQLSGKGISAQAIHGGRSQPQRDRALAQFSEGKCQVLVATDVAARGIHVDGVHCVIHFDVPEDHKTYVHRSGRTARAGASGIVISLVDPDKLRDVAQMQRKLEMAAGVIEPNFLALPEKAPAFAAVVIGKSVDISDDDTDIEEEGLDQVSEGSARADSGDEPKKPRRPRRPRRRRTTAA